MMGRDAPAVTFAAYAALITEPISLTQSLLQWFEIGRVCHRALRLPSDGARFLSQTSPVPGVENTGSHRREDRMPYRKPFAKNQRVTDNAKTRV